MGAVGTIGLLDTPGAGTRLDAAAHLGPSPLVVALVAWAVVTPLSSLAVARCRRSLSDDRGPLSPLDVR